MTPEIRKKRSWIMWGVIGSYGVWFVAPFGKRQAKKFQDAHMLSGCKIKKVRVTEL